MLVQMRLTLLSAFARGIPAIDRLLQRLCSIHSSRVCYYVPPSLRSKLSVGPRGSLEQQQSVKRLPATLTYNANKPLNTYVTPKTNAPLSNGVSNYVIPKTNAPFGNGVSNYVTPKKNAPFGNGVNTYVTPKMNVNFDNGATQRKVDMANNSNQDTAWNNKPVRIFNVKDAKYRPPGRKSPLAASMDKNWVFARGTSETANRRANATIGGRWTQSQRQQQQPAMKAGWVGESGDMFLRPNQPSNPYSRKIAG